MVLRSTPRQFDAFRYAQVLRYIKAAAEIAVLPTLIENLRMELLINRDTAPIFAEDVAK